MFFYGTKKTGSVGDGTARHRPAPRRDDAQPAEDPARPGPRGARQHREPAADARRIQKVSPLEFHLDFVLTLKIYSSIPSIVSKIETF